MALIRYLVSWRLFNIRYLIRKKFTSPSIASYIESFYYAKSPKGNNTKIALASQKNDLSRTGFVTWELYHNCFMDIETLRIPWSHDPFCPWNCYSQNGHWKFASVGFSGLRFPKKRYAKKIWSKNLMLRHEYFT